jgi:hypothetical protein
VIASIADLVDFLKQSYRRWREDLPSASAVRDREEARLSAEFLSAHGARLDAIGRWTVTAGADDLQIDWDSPAAFAGQWVPFGLRFHFDGAGGSLDPDERMFRLWELYLSLRDEFAAQLRELADGARGVVGPAEEARVVVYRSEDEAGQHFYALTAEVRFERDVEHLYWAEYNEQEGRFGSLWC